MIKKEKKNLEIDFHTYLIKYFKLFFLIVPVLILGSGYLVLIKPKYEHLKALEGENQKREAEFSEQENYLKKLTELEEAYNHIDPKDIEKMKRILPPKEKNEELFPLLESLVVNHGILLTSLTIEDAKGPSKELPEGIGAQKISLGVMGTDYSTLKNLLKSLENNLPLLDVIKVSFSPEDSKTSLDAVSYYSKK